jgi:hypothetical protein
LHINRSEKNVNQDRLINGGRYEKLLQDKLHDKKHLSEGQFLTAFNHLRVGQETLDIAQGALVDV